MCIIWSRNVDETTRKVTKKHSSFERKILKKIYGTDYDVISGIFERQIAKTITIRMCCQYSIGVYDSECDICHPLKIRKVILEKLNEERRLRKRNFGWRRWFDMARKTNAMFDVMVRIQWRGIVEVVKNPF